MKNLKITFAVVFFSLISNAVVAQVPKSEKEDQKIEMAKQFKISKEKLALTPEQEIKFKNISKNFIEKAKVIKEADSDKKSKRKQLKELQSQKNEEMKSLLSENQFKTYLELNQERRELMKDRAKKD